MLLNEAIDFINSFSDSASKKSSYATRNQLMASMMLEVGLRVSEVCAFPLGELPELSEYGNSTPARVIGKGSKARVILIPNRLLKHIWEYVDLERAQIVERRGAKVTSDTVFISNAGKRLSRNWIEKLFHQKSLSRTVKVHPHLLRHTFGTYHYLLNKDLCTLTKLMGHSSEETTRSFYVHSAGLIAQSEKYKGLQESIDQLIRFDFG